MVAKLYLAFVLICISLVTDEVEHLSIYLSNSLHILFCEQWCPHPLLTFVLQDLSNSF